MLSSTKCFLYCNREKIHICLLQSEERVESSEKVCRARQGVVASVWTEDAAQFSDMDRGGQDAAQCVNERRWAHPPTYLQSARH